MLFLITGPDTYRARQKLRALKEKFLHDVDPTGLSLRTVAGERLKPSDLTHYFATAGLFARRRFIVFEDFLARQDPTTVAALPAALEPLADDRRGNIIVFFEPEPLPPSAPLTRWLVRHAHVQQFPHLEGAALAAWVGGELTARGRTASAPALRRLLAVGAGDPWRLANELAKLDALLPSGAAIGEAAVAELTVEPFDENIFPLIDAVVSGDLARGGPLLAEHLERATSPQPVVALLERQLRTLILLAADPSGRTPHLPGVPPHVARKLRPVARRAGLGRLKRIYADLLEVDVGLKTSVADAKTLLLRFLTRSFSARDS